MVVGSAATDPVPDPALPHVGPLTWGDPEAQLPPAVPPPGRRPLIFLYGGKLRYAPGMPLLCDSAIVVDVCVQALADLDVDVVVGARKPQMPRVPPAQCLRIV